MKGKNLKLENLIKAFIAGLATYGVVVYLSLDPAMSAGIAAVAAVLIRDVVY